MPFTHAFTGSNPVQVTNFIGAWFNGRASVSKTVDAGSIPAAPAIKKIKSNHRLFFLPQIYSTFIYFLSHIAGFPAFFSQKIFYEISLMNNMKIIQNLMTLFNYS